MPPTLPAHPSPKRKRNHHQPPPMPLLNTTLALRPAPTPPQHVDAAPSSGADSPRNAVADQLRSMDIAAASTMAMSPLTPTEHVAHKKLKLDGARDDGQTWPGTAFPGTDVKTGEAAVSVDAAVLRPWQHALSEVPETPQAPQPRMLPEIASFAQPTVSTSSPDRTSPLPYPVADQAPGFKNGSLRLASPSKSPPASLSALTWQFSEITGHLADPSTDPDDDGTGLNGIGFKPTPAIAYARSQKRRQQLLAWKAREAREARARRSERRRRGVGGKASRESTMEREMSVPEADFSQRTVKFAV